MKKLLIGTYHLGEITGNLGRDELYEWQDDPQPIKTITINFKHPEKTIDSVYLHDVLEDVNDSLAEGSLNAETEDYEMEVE